MFEYQAILLYNQETKNDKRVSKNDNERKDMYIMYDDIKIKVYNAVIEGFSKKGLKFTIDEVAASINMSKKTIYKVFDSKEQILRDTINYGFDQVKLSEQKVIEDDSLDILEKIKMVLIAMPDRYREIDWRNINVLNKKYPQLYQLIVERIENCWEKIYELFEEAIRTRRMKNISVPVLKIMIESSYEGFLSKDILKENDINYDYALMAMLDIIFDGICN